MGECFLERDRVSWRKGSPQLVGGAGRHVCTSSEIEGARAMLCVERESTPLEVWGTSECDTPLSKFEFDVINLLIRGPDFH